MVDWECLLRWGLAGALLFVARTWDYRRPTHRFGGEDMSDNQCLSLEPGYIPVRIRRRVLERDGKRCVWCGEAEERRVSHFIQKRTGGETSYYNLVTTCEACKRERQYLSPSEFIAKLKLKESEVFRDMAMQIQVIKQNGDMIQGEVDDMPNPNAPYAKGFWLRYPGNGEREFIFFEQGMRIKQLGGRQIRNKD